jgi:hypothetical protein
MENKESMGFFDITIGELQINVTNSNNIMAKSSP